MNNRGFVFTGFAFLLVIPALILAASFFNMLKLGSEAASIAATSGAVFYAYDNIRASFEETADNLVLKYGNNAQAIENELAAWRASITGNYSTRLGLNVTIGSIGAKKEGNVMKIGKDGSEGSGIPLQINSLDNKIILSRELDPLQIPI